MGDTHKTVGLRLDIEIETTKSPTGRILGYHARFGELEGSGATKDAAIESLRKALARITRDVGRERIISDASADFHVMVKQTGQYWGYVHIVPVARKDGAGCDLRTGCLTGGWETFEEATAAAKQHLHSLTHVQCRLCGEHKPNAQHACYVSGPSWQRFPSFFVCRACEAQHVTAIRVVEALRSLGCTPVEGPAWYRSHTIAITDTLAEVTREEAA